MKENQQDKNLQFFRAEIDKIDDQIIALLQERLKVVAKVANLKQNNGEKFFIKSARESDMIKNLIKKAGTNLAPSLIVNIWRKIITNANMHEQPIKVVIHNPKDIHDYKYLIREYYSEIVPINELDSASSIILELEKNNEQIAVFSVPNSFAEDEENWWINLANNKIGLKIFAKAPLIKYADNEGSELFLAAVKKPEKSESDSSLMVIEFDDKLPKSELLTVLETYGFQAKILKSVKIKQMAQVTFNLVEVEGFYLEDDAALALLQKDKTHPFVKIIGHFAHQIEE
jgi:chorismate mutase